VHGGAYKCPQDFPYGNDWCVIGGGTFIDLIIDTIIGADLSLFDGIQVRSRVDDFDPATRLVGLNYQGKTYTVTRQGAVR
jgi:hypothetical protein